MATFSAEARHKSHLQLVLVLGSRYFGKGLSQVLESPKALRSVTPISLITFQAIRDNYLITWKPTSNTLLSFIGIVGAVNVVPVFADERPLLLEALAFLQPFR